MPLYLVERTLSFDRDRDLPGLDELLLTWADLIPPQNTNAAAVWIHSFVTPDSKRSFCLYKGPNPEAVRQVAGFRGLPIDRINEVHLQAPSTSPDMEPSRALLAWVEAARQQGNLKSFLGEPGE